MCSHEKAIDRIVSAKGYISRWEWLDHPVGGQPIFSMLHADAVPGASIGGVVTGPMRDDPFSADRRYRAW